MTELTHPHRSFYFIRHGQTDWNVAGRMQGHTDIPLNPTGIEQAHQAAALLENIEFDLIISSPLSRAYQTAEIIAQRKGVQIISEPLLKERHFGRFEGKTVDEIYEALGLEKGSAISWALPPCAEQWPETKSRSLKIVSEYLNRFEERILFVSHGAVFRAIYEGLFEQRHHAENAKPYYFHLNDNKQWTMTDYSLDKNVKTSSPKP